jgi:hypothetical protein
MRDEEYRPEQIPTYGSHEQLALAERMRPLLRMTQVGNGFALLAVLAAISALFTYPINLYSDNAGRGWAIAALICSVLLLGVCTFQHLCWLRAMAVWRDQSQTDVRQLRTFSYAAALASYLVVAVALWVAIAGIVYAGWLATASILLMLTLVFMLVAQVLAGVQYVRVSGPPGTVPAHMRRVVVRENLPRTP